MRERETLKKLINDGTIATTLSKDSSARHAITALQTLLHWKLGDDEGACWTGSSTTCRRRPIALAMS